MPQNIPPVYPPVEVNHHKPENLNILSNSLPFMGSAMFFYEL